MTLILILCLNYYYLKMFIFRFVFFSNTLETMSARSFGFIKPSQKFRDNDMANRIRRHQSFFNADTSSITGKRERRRDWELRAKFFNILFLENTRDRRAIFLDRSLRLHFLNFKEKKGERARIFYAYLMII